MKILCRVACLVWWSLPSIARVQNDREQTKRSLFAVIEHYVMCSSCGHKVTHRLFACDVDIFWSSSFDAFAILVMRRNALAPRMSVTGFLHKWVNHEGESWIPGLEWLSLTLLSAFVCCRWWAQMLFSQHCRACQLCKSSFLINFIMCSMFRRTTHSTMMLAR